MQRDHASSARVERVPAGQVALHVCEPDSGSEGPADCPVLLEFELAAGETRTLRLP